MPRVHTRKKNRAGKERRCGRAGCGKVIAPGDTYYTFEFRYGGAHYRCAEHYPRQSELTQSKLSQVYAAQEDFQPGDTQDDLESAVAQVAETVREVADEYREAAEHFGGEGENAERADELESWTEELENWVWDDDADLDANQQAAQEVVDGCPL